MKLRSLAVTALFFSLLMLSNRAFSAPNYNVGVSPGSIDLGEVEAGTTKVVDFYIVTMSEETMLVRLDPETVIFDTVPFKNNFSEENMLSWINIIDNPVELEPKYETLQTLGGSINSHRQVSFLINIPDDAEPGYHMIKMKPVPLATREEIGSVGSMVVAVTSVKVMFNVAGDPVRKGTILDVETGSYREGSVEMKTYFQNTGTVTISANGNQKIYDKEGKLVGTINLGKTYIAPKEIKTFRGTLKTADLPPEEYNVYTVIDYTTGKAEKSSSIELSPATSLAIEQGGDMTLLFLILIVLIVSIIIYRRVR
ncbi:MAG: hypothetical protein V1818_01475 [Candidatus Aenigmatarchaeota archaeon]